MYTSYTFGSSIFVAFYCLYRKTPLQFILLVLLPFMFIINGLLTGMYIESEVVWYNDLHTLEVRILQYPLKIILCIAIYISKGISL